jgi:hypothetical protein
MPTAAITRTADSSSQVSTGLQADAARLRELELKPATLEEAIERAVGWRVEAERRRLEQDHAKQLSELHQQLTAVKAK